MGIFRLALALAVLATHTGAVLGHGVSDPALDVEAFYLISGFLMQLVLEGRYNPKSQKALFYSNRALRIFPSYFVILVVSIVLGVYSAGSSNPGYYGAILSRLHTLNVFEIAFWATTQFTIFGQEILVFLGSSSTHGWVWSGAGPDDSIWTFAFIPPAWSVSLELVFYLVVPFLAQLRSRWLVLLVALSFSVRWVSFAVGFAHDPWTYRFFPFELGIFVSGMLACRARHWLQVPTDRRRLVVPVLIMAVLVMPILEKIGLRVDIQWPVWQGLFLSFLFILTPSLFASGEKSSIDASLGELSYPLYLSHWMILSIYTQYVSSLSGPWQATGRGLVVAVVALMVSFLLARFVDRNVSRLRSRRRAASPATREALTPSP